MQRSSRRSNLLASASAEQDYDVDEDEDEEYDVDERIPVTVSGSRGLVAVLASMLV